MIHSTLVFNIVYIHPHTQPFNSPLNGTNWGSRYQKKHSPTHTHEEGFTYTVLYTLGKNGKVLLQIGRPFVGSYKITSKKQLTLVLNENENQYLKLTLIGSHILLVEHNH